MPFYDKAFTIAGKKISLAALIWFLLALVAIFVQLGKGAGSINNYFIFKGVFWHTVQQTHLYHNYPAEYFDSNHYGPFFSIIIAPFAVLPDMIGCFLWGLVNAVILFYAVRRLPLDNGSRNLILLIGAVEMMTAMHNMQFNPMLTSWILLTWILVKEEKDFWATLFIAAGILTKLYGIVGLAFFLFSANRLRFVVSFIFWMLVLAMLPMIISSPAFVWQSYQDWYQSLVEKNDANTESVMQGMSAMRVIKKIFRLPGLPDLYIIATAAIFYLLPLLRFKQYKQVCFQLSYLAFLLIGVVIFSSSAESPTFVIAMIGVGIWYVIQPGRKGWALWLMLFAIVLTSLSTTDLFPKSIKVDYIRPYALKALPCLITWLVLAYQLLIKKFDIAKCPA